MASDLIVVTASTIPANDPRSGTLKLYLDQLAAAGIESHVTSLKEMPHADGGAPGTLEYFITVLRQVAHQFSGYEKIVATDAWDVTFYGSKEEVIRKIPTDKCLIGAAKECYPWGFAARERTSEDTCRMYANGGLIAGTPETFLKLADAMKSHLHYRSRFENQGMFNLMLKEKSEAFHHDNRTELFYCLYDGYDDLDFEKGLPINTLCNTRPQFLHANGKWDTAAMFARYERSLQ